MANKDINVLIVDDDEIDVMAIRRAFTKRRIANPIHVAHDGIEALEILRGSNDQQRLERPYIILLDINMPRMNGLELLDALRADRNLKDSIVFVLTTSNDDRDRIEAFRYNIAGYILKTNPGDSFLEAIGLIEHYWKVVQLPS